MDIRIYDSLPREAMEIRKRVFVDEQGFTDVPDETDAAAVHILLWDGDDAVATARILPYGDGNMLVGRIAVLPTRRGGGLGRIVVGAAERAAREMGASRIVIHAQKHACGFYLALGYSSFGEEDSVEGKAHVWMEKILE